MIYSIKPNGEWESLHRLKSDLFHNIIPMEKRKEKDYKADLRLRELKRWTKVYVWWEEGLLEFLWIDGMYARWMWEYGELVIMGHANQKVSEYGEILWHKSDFYSLI